MRITEDIIYYWLSVSGLSARRANALLRRYTPNMTIIRVGHLNFKIEVPRYKRLLEDIRDSGIFEEKEIAAEMKRRLLEND